MKVVLTILTFWLLVSMQCHTIYAQTNKANTTKIASAKSKAKKTYCLLDELDFRNPKLTESLSAFIDSLPPLEKNEVYKISLKSDNVSFDLFCTINRQAA